MNYLVLGGAGQVGKAVIKNLIQKNAKLIIVHGLTKNEVDNSVRVLKSFSKELNKSPKLIKVWGNLFATSELKDVPIRILKKSSVNRKKLINFLTDNKKWKPGIIINCVNSATYIGYFMKPVSSLKNIKDELHSKSTNKNINSEVIESYLLSRGGAYIHKWFDELYNILYNTRIKYICVSTTGFGGMGFNLLWTHGESNQKGASEELISKAMVAGMNQQLLWNLSHTPNVDVNLVIPAALIGWDGFYKSNIKRGKQTVKIINKIREIDLLNDKKCKFKFKNNFSSNNELSNLVINTGENGLFGLEEFKAITAPGQMEIVSKEEVAKAVDEIIHKDYHQEVLRALDRVSLGPSKKTFRHLEKELEKIKKLKIKFPSIAFGNLGPYITKLIFELAIISFVLKKLITIKKISVDELGLMINEYLHSNKEYLSEILSIGMPILTYKTGKLLFPEKPLFPDVNELRKIDMISINRWSDIGWIDFRSNNLKLWKKRLLNVVKDIEKVKKGNPIAKNSKFIDYNKKINIGYVLASILSIEGGGRK